MSRDSGFDRQIYREVEPRRHGHSPEHPDRIFLETFHRVADAADDSRFQVVESARVIDDRARRDVVEQRVDGEVAPECVLFGGAERIVAVKKSNMPGRLVDCSVDICMDVGCRQLFSRQLPPECRHLDRLRPKPHMREAKASSDDPAVSEQSLDLVWVRGRADVEVFRPAPQEEVPDAAAYEVGDEMFPVQPVKHTERVGVDLLAGDVVLLPWHDHRLAHQR